MRFCRWDSKRSRTTTRPIAPQPPKTTNVRFAAMPLRVWREPSGLATAAIGRGRDAGELPELPGEEIRVAIAEFFRDGFDRQRRIGEQRTRRADPALQRVGVWGEAGRAFELPAERARAE